MSKKVYAPGEMFHESFWKNFAGYRNYYADWTLISQLDRASWAAREKSFFNLLSQQCKEDEQTDDTSGVPLNDYSQD